MIRKADGWLFLGLLALGWGVIGCGSEAPRDTTPPTASLSGTPPEVTDNTNMDVAVGGEEVVAYRYRLDGGDWSEETEVSVHIVASDLSEGPHTLEVTGRDEAGNWQPVEEATSYSWLIDIPPSTIWSSEDITKTVSRFRQHIAQTADGHYHLLLGYQEESNCVFRAIELYDLQATQHSIDSISCEEMLGSTDMLASANGHLHVLYALELSSDVYTIQHVEFDGSGWHTPKPVGPSLSYYVHPGRFIESPNGHLHVLYRYRDTTAENSRLEHSEYDGASWTTKTIHTLDWSGQDPFGWGILPRTFTTTSDGYVHTLYEVSRYNQRQELYHAVYDGSGWSGQSSPIELADNAGGGSSGSGFSFGASYHAPNGHWYFFYERNFRPVTDVPEPDDYFEYISDTDWTPQIIEVISHRDRVYASSTGVQTSDGHWHLFYLRQNHSDSYYLDDLKHIEHNGSDILGPKTIAAQKYKIYDYEHTTFESLDGKLHLIYRYRLNNVDNDTNLDHAVLEGTWSTATLSSSTEYGAFNDCSPIVQSSNHHLHVLYSYQPDATGHVITHAEHDGSDWSVADIGTGEVDFSNTAFQSSSGLWYLTYGRDPSTLLEIGESVTSMTVPFTYEDVPPLHQTSDGYLHAFWFADNGDLNHAEYQNGTWYEETIDAAAAAESPAGTRITTLPSQDHFYLVYHCPPADYYNYTRVKLAIGQYEPW